MVVDPHDRRPFACAWFVVSPRNEIIFVREWPDFDFFGTRNWHWGVEQYTELFHNARDELGLTRMTWFLMDPRFGKTPSAFTGTTLMEEFERGGFYFDRELLADNLEAGHLLVRDALKERRVFWLDTCMNFVKGMRLYSWQEWGRGMYEKAPKAAPQEKYKDFPDLARYTLEGGVGWVDPDDYNPISYMGANLGMGARKF